MKEIRFLADAMLGKLSKWLRIIGFDTLYYRDAEDDKLVELAIKENRQILTRKTSLRNRKDINNQLFFISENNPCLLYTSPSPRDRQKSRMPSSA